MQLKSKLTSDFFIYMVGTYLVQAIGILTSFAMRYFLEPSSMGAWSLLDLLLSYSLYVNLGISAALYTEMPFYVGKGDQEKACRIRNVSFTYMLASSSLIGAALLIFSIFGGGLLPPPLRNGISAIAFIAVTTSINNYYISLMIAEKNFKLLSQGNLVNAAVYLLLVLLLVSRFGLPGLLASVLISNFLSCLFFQWRSGSSLRWEWDGSVFWMLLKCGFPLMLVGFAYASFVSMDRILVAKLCGLTELGHYSIAIMVISYAMAIPKLLAVVVFPNMQERYGETSSHAQTRVFVTKPAMLLAYGSPLLLGFAYFIAPYLVSWLLPKYVPGIGAMKIFLLGSFFLAVSQPIQNYLTTIHKRLHPVPFVALSAAVAAGLAYYFVQHGQGIRGVALGMGAGFFIFYSTLAFHVFKHFYSFRESLLFYLETLFCFLYFLTTAVAIDAWPVWGGAPVKAALFTAGMIPMLFFANKKTGALSVLWNVLRAKAAV